MTTARDARAMLSSKEPTRSGRVVAVGLGSVSISTVYGRRMYSVPDASVYAVGDTVRYNGDLLVGRIPKPSSLPIYSV